MNLTKSLNKWFLFTLFLLIIGLVSSFKYEEKISYNAFFINLGYVFLFFIIVHNAIKNKKKSVSSLIFVCSFFSLFFLLLFKMLYFNETGSFFEFTARDSLQYNDIAVKINNSDFIQGLRNFILTEDIEDFGAAFFTSLAYKIYPSTIMFNIFNVVAGIITIASLYRLCVYFMSKEYAYYTSLIYGLSSFVIYLYSTGMKETFFVMFVILFFEFLARFIKKRKIISLFFSILFLLALYFFRPAVMFMIILSVFSSIIYVKRKGLLSLLFLLPLLFVGVMFLIDDIQTIGDKYYGSAEVVSERAAYFSGIQATPFNYTVSVISGLFGPLPTYTPLQGSLQQYFYSCGIGIRVLLSVFFWFGVFKAFQSKNLILLAICFFTIFEMLSLSFILESFELRLNSPHLIFTYFLSFYYLYTINNEENIIVYKKVYSLGILSLMVLIILWNVLTRV